MGKRMVLILLFCLCCIYNQLTAQKTLEEGPGIRKWRVIKGDPICSAVISAYNKSKDKTIQLDLPLEIWVKEISGSGTLKYEVLNVIILGVPGGDLPLDNVEAIIGRGLCERIAQRKYLWEEIGSPPTSDLIASGYVRDVYWWTPKRWELSVFQIVARPTNKYGGEFRIGDDELGFPFWTAGVYRVGISTQILKVFGQLPLGTGKSHEVLRTRLLDGALGGGIIFDTDNFGGRVSFGDITKKIGDNFINDNNVYYITVALQGYYTFTVPIRRLLPGSLRIRVGGGYHQVVNSYVDSGDPEKRLVVRERFHKLSPYIRSDFVTVDSTLEASAQFYNTSLLFVVAYNITSWLAFEAKFSVWDLIRNRDPWEQPNFFMISPKVRL